MENTKINFLLHKASDDALIRVEKVLRSIAEITHYQNLTIKKSDTVTFIDVRIHLKHALNKQLTRIICDNVEDEIRKIIRKSTVFVHAESK